MTVDDDQSAYHLVHIHHKTLSGGDDGAESLSQIARTADLVVLASTTDAFSRVIPTVGHQIYGRPPMSAPIISFPFLFYLLLFSASTPFSFFFLL